MLTTLSSAMSTPSSMVGEQKSTGSLAARNSSSRSHAGLVGDLGGVLAGVEALGLQGDGAVEAHEELVGLAAPLGRVRDADGVVEGLGAVARHPAQGGGRDLVALDLALRIDRRDDAGGAQGLQQVLDDLLLVVELEIVGPVIEGARAPEVLAEAAAGGDVDESLVVVARPARAGRRSRSAPCARCRRWPRGRAGAGCCAGAGAPGRGRRGSRP